MGIRRNDYDQQSRLSQIEEVDTMIELATLLEVAIVIAVVVDLVRNNL